MMTRLPVGHCSQPQGRHVLLVLLAAFLALGALLLPGVGNDVAHAMPPPVACTVTTTADGTAPVPVGSLREKLADIGCASIVFNLGGSAPWTITLVADLPTVTRTVSVTGPGATSLTVNRNSTTPQATAFPVGASGNLTLSELTVSGGWAGVLLQNGGIARVNNTIFSGNNLGMFLFLSATATVTNSTFATNTAGIDLVLGGTATVTNSTFASNTYGIYFYQSGGTATVTNSTFASNTTGVNFDAGGAATLTNTLLAHGGNPNCAYVSPATGSAVTNGDYNLADDTSCFADNSGSSSSSHVRTTAQLGLDPVGPADHGGSTPTLALLPGSAALDVIPATGANCPATDQRGITRPQLPGGVCDIGAFESRGFTLTATSGTSQSAVIGTAFANPLVVTVASANSEPVQGGVVTFTGPGSGAGIQSSPLTAAVAANGQASANVTANGTVGGPYTVAASAAGAASGVNFSLTNVAISTTLVAADASGIYSGTTNLSATLTATSGGAAISGKTIAFTLNGSPICGGGGQPACPTTDGSGVALLANVGLAGIDAGTYPTGIGATFAGDSTHATSTDTAQLAVAKAATALSQVRGAVTYGDTTGSVTATLRRTDGDGGPVADARVRFAVNGVAVCGGGGQPNCPKTNAQGVATLAGVAFPAGLGGGSYPNAVVASFNGDDNHLAAARSGPLVVARRILWVKPVDQTVKLKQPNPTGCTLELANGSAFANGDDFGDLNLSNLRCTTSRNYPSSNASETVGKQYKLSATGVLSTNYDIRYQQGTLTVVP